MNFLDNTLRLGYGAMGLEGVYGKSDDKEAIETLKYVIEKNMMIDTSDAYGNGHNEELIAKAIKQANKEAFVATKFGIVFEENIESRIHDTGWGLPIPVNGSKAYVKHAIEQSLKRLDVEALDLLYIHFVDPETPIEETVGAMSEAVKEGKVKSLGLSNPSVDEILRANKIHNISAVQYEYSLFNRNAENGILSTTKDIGAKFVSWGPLGNGILSGNVNSLENEDFRNNNPKFTGENFKTNLQKVETFKELAKDLDLTPAQLSLAWLLNKDENIIPIPGSKKISRIEENLKALDIKLDVNVINTIEELLPLGTFKGNPLIMK